MIVPRIAGSEIFRKSVHTATGCLALSLRWLDPIYLVPIALLGVVFNALVLPKLDGWLFWRPEERSSGAAVGVVTYPVTVLILLLVFRHRPEVIAAGWGVLAFGDGAAAITGQLWGCRKLPWNSEKSWAGLLGFFVAGTVAVWGLVSWVSPGLFEFGSLIGMAAATSIMAALLESSNQHLDDNLAVPLIAALFFLCLEQAYGGWSWLVTDDSLLQLTTAVGVNLLFALVGMWIGGLTGSGAIAAWLIGTTIFWSLGLPGYLCLLTFFLVATLATRVGGARKTALAVAEERGGRRRAANALANGSVAAACSIFAVVTPYTEVYLVAFVTSLAAACADTVESEVGQVWGRPTLLITTFRAVEPGTHGGVSAIGTLAGLVAALVITAEGAAVGFFGWNLVPALSVTALIATLLESVVGATIERRGLLDNQGVNFFNTLVAGLLGVLVFRVVF